MLYKWDTGGTPSQVMELQEMVVDGQGNSETGGSTSDRIFFMKYPMSFLQHWYGTFPPVQKDTTTTGTSDVSPPSVGVNTDMTGERNLITPSKISWTSTMRCSVARIDETNQTFSTDPRMFRTRTQMGKLDLC